MSSFVSRYCARLLAISTCFGAVNVVAEEAAIMPVHGSIAYYIDTREYNTLALQTRIQNLPLNLEFYGYTDLHALPDSGTKREDMRYSQSEYTLRHDGISRLANVPGLAIEAEWSDGTPADDDLGRFGVSYSVWIQPVDQNARPGVISLRAFPLETDGDGMQFGIQFSIPMSKSLLLHGFADYDVHSDADNQWVIEPEIRYALNAQVGALMEFRYNTYFESQGIDRTGIAIGLQVQY